MRGLCECLFCGWWYLWAASLQEEKTMGAVKGAWNMSSLFCDVVRLLVWLPSR